MLRNAVRKTSGSAAGLLVRQRRRHVHRRAGVHDDLLGVAAAGEQRHGAVADPPAAHGGADLGHLAGAFEAENRRRAGRRRIEALALQQVGAVDRGGADADADVLRPELAAAARRRCAGRSRHRAGRTRWRAWSPRWAVAIRRESTATENACGGAEAGSSSSASVASRGVTETSRHRELFLPRRRDADASWYLRPLALSCALASRKETACQRARLVLVGGGHSHVLVLAGARRPLPSRAAGRRSSRPTATRPTPAWCRA